MPNTLDKRTKRSKVSGDFVQSLERGLAVIRAFDAEHSEMRLSEVATATGLTRAAARRFLLTLVELGYVRLEDGRFSLRPRLLELGYSYLSGLGFAELAMPHLRSLGHQLREAVSASVLDGTEVVCVASVPAQRIVAIDFTVGTRLPAYGTSGGRVLLAQLDDDELGRRLASITLRKLTPATITSKRALRAELEAIREQGWATVDRELEEGLRSVAAPIRQGGGGDAVAVEVWSPSARGKDEGVRARQLPLLRKAAAQIGGTGCW